MQIIQFSMYNFTIYTIFTSIGSLGRIYGDASTRE